MPAPLACRAVCIWNRNSFQPEWFTWLRKMRGIHEPSLAERRVPYGRDHERHFPDRGRAFHFDWNALKGARDLGNAQPMRGLGLRELDG
jgi:hypothetical protein